MSPITVYILTSQSIHVFIFTSWIKWDSLEATLSLRPLQAVNV